MISCTDIAVIMELRKERGQAILLKLALANDFGYDYDVERDVLTAPDSHTPLDAQTQTEAESIIEDVQRRLTHADETAFHAEHSAYTDVRIQPALFTLKSEYASLFGEAAWLAGRFGIQLSSDFGQSFARLAALTALRHGGHIDESGVIVPHRQPEPEIRSASEAAELIAKLESEAAALRPKIARARELGRESGRNHVGARDAAERWSAHLAALEERIQALRDEWNI